ncbi:SulP family inorganic anion transporter [Sorangium sp. So ce1151]|uniref:SulP family inorganic anion transporter n=1 Tax=Sorangium sp. So ce1151 TaxID=3133332 RepID=UPI003F607B61
MSTRPQPSFWGSTWAETVTSWKEMVAPRSLVDNLLSGLTVAFVALPLNLALALACGLPASAGLITGAVTGVIAALIGGSRLQVTGPEVALVPLTFEILQRHGPHGLLCATFLCGVLQVIMGAARVGRLIHMIPVSVIGGFMAAVGLLVFNSQLPRLLGLPTEMRLVSSLPGTGWLAHVDLFAVGIGALVIAATVLLPKLHRRLPGGLIGLGAAIAAVSVLGVGTASVGPISASFPAPSLPEFHRLEFIAILPEAIALALLASIDSLLSAVAIDAQSNAKRHSSEQELVAQGVSNMVSSMIGGMPVAGAIVRSSAALQCGATTRLAALTQSVTLLGLLYLARPFVERLPLAGLAGILLVVGYRLINWQQARFMWRVSRFEAFVFVATAASIVVSDFVGGVLMGLVLSLVHFAHMQRRVDVSLVTALTDEPAEIPRLLELPARRSLGPTPPVAVVRVEGPIFFASHTELRSLAEGDPLPRHLVFDLAGVPLIDCTGIQAFRALLARLREQGTRALVSRASEAVAERLEEAGILREVAGGRVFPTVAEALGALEEPAAKASIFAAPRGQLASALLRPEAPAGAS